MPKNELAIVASSKPMPTTAHLPLEPMHVVAPNTTLDVHVATPTKLSIRATTFKLKPEITIETGSPPKIVAKTGYLSNPNEKTYISDKKNLQPTLMPTNEHKKIEIDGKN